MSKEMSDQSTPSSTISASFLADVHDIYFNVLEIAIRNEQVKAATSMVVTREGINILTDRALSCYIIAVAAVEAFVNEVFLGMREPFMANTPLAKLPEEWLEKVDISIKLIVLPQLACGRSFQKDQKPYQDMATLIKIRNDLVHYKMGKPSSYVKHLQERHIALQWSNVPWTFALSTSEGIRWAYNTACETIRGVHSFIPDDFQRSMLAGFVEHSLSTISEKQIKDLFVEYQINL